MVTGRRSTRRKPKRVRFSELSQLFLIAPKTREDVQNSWYTRKELTRFKQRVRETSTLLGETRTAKAMKYIACSAASRSKPVNIRVHSKESIRGIEHLISHDVTSALMRQRAIHRARVLAEQRSQRISGRCNPSRIAMVSELASTFSKEWWSRITLMQRDVQQD
ncbi:hypothetical protein ACHAWF_017718 [Thalassiosira exigua]